MNPRPLPCQGSALPLSYSPTATRETPHAPALYTIGKFRRNAQAAPRNSFRSKPATVDSGCSPGANSARIPSRRALDDLPDPPIYYLCRTAWSRAAQVRGVLPKWRNGRRAWFRTTCPQGRGGSNPLFGITLSTHPSHAAANALVETRGGTSVVPPRSGWRWLSGSSGGKERSNAASAA